MKQDDSIDTNGEAAPARSAMSRRSLLRSSLKVSPVIATLASRPVLATTCVTASISVSAGSPGRVSGPSSTWTSCSGWSPAKWCNSYSAWPSSCSPYKDKKFNTIFNQGGYESGATLWTVMKNWAQCSESDENKLLARNVCAAWLNYTAGTVDPTKLTLVMIQDAWNKGRTSAYPVVGAGNWGPAKLNPWLGNMFSA